MSEKRDLWVAAVLACAGIGLLALNLAADRALLGVLCLVLGLTAAVICMPLRLREGQLRVVLFGTGVALCLVPAIPGAADSMATALPWIVGGLAFILPLRRLEERARVVLLATAAVLAVAGLVAVTGALPGGLMWLFLAGAFHLAAQVFTSRPKIEPAPPPGPRVCLMGGSFDPFHRGHRKLAEAALRVVDRLLVIPAGNAPHKGGRDATPFHHRVQMSRLGVEGLPRTEVLELEGRRTGPSYTIDTLNVIRRSYPPGTRYLLLVGADMYQDFPNWKSWEEILQLATLLVARRPGYDVEAPPEFEGRSVPAEGLEASLVDVSSTQLRAEMAADRSVGDLVSPAVQAYVRDHGLYRSPR